jgi:hypothetical protein
MYWGAARLSGTARLVYKLAKKDGAVQYSGHVQGSPYYWGDLCRDRVRYCRNFVFREVNTLAACPMQPYHDPARPDVRFWYASSEGADPQAFVNTISEANQDRLEAEQGACITYTHFGKGFVEAGNPSARFRELMDRLSRKNGWFVPVSTLLDHIREQRGDYTISSRERAALEWRWLRQKLKYGSA